jgi:DNA-binding response OmpR family regulator/ribonuclease BN (tRNA processing enzyme)
MNNRVLFVDDDGVIFEQMKEMFKRRSWAMDWSADGQEGLQVLRARATEYRCIILDLKMPAMDGEVLLAQLNKEGVRLPPIIVLSGWLDPESARRCIELGAICILAKPVEGKDLIEIVRAITSGTNKNIQRLFESNSSLFGVLNNNNETIILSIKPHALQPEKTEHSISSDVARREEALKRYFLDVTKVTSQFSAEEPLLLVGRRWNSWYPSFFDTCGGAYAILVPKKGEGRLQAAIIDPGFSSLRALGQLGVSIRDMESCLIAHNHPDHVGGVFEYIACRHVIGESTTIKANLSVCRMLEGYNGPILSVSELNREEVDLFSVVPNPLISSRHLTVCGIETAHEEAGRQSSTLGLVIASTFRARGGSPERRKEIVVLGDTGYERHQHRERFVTKLINHNVTLMVVHIGCSQLKFKLGKHLYLEGLQNLLADIDSHLATIQYNGKFLVLVSEWGLEHATSEQIREICGEHLTGFDTESPIVSTISILGKRLKKITLLPADAGLMVGMESGFVYLKNGTPIPSHQIRFSTSKEGLIYRAPWRPLGE